MALPQDPERPERASSRGKRPEVLSGTFRSPDRLRDTLKQNPRRYTNVVEVAGGSGFAVRDELLIHLTFEDTVLDKVLDLEGFPVKFIRKLVIGGTEISKAELEESCLCLGPETILVRKEGITDGFTDDTPLSVELESITPPLSIKSGRPPQLIDQPKIAGSYNYYVSGDAVTPASGEDWTSFLAALMPSTPRATIAVVDTGIHIGMANVGYWSREAANPCSGESFPAKQIGWDFVERDAQPDDDNAYLHGTTVAQLAFGQSPGASVMILKAFDEEGIGQLDRILCALWYARKNKAHVVNLSFGYYGEEIPVLRRFLEHLGKNKTVVVAAAGNHTDFDGIPNDIGVRKFYPACFSADLPNVLAVTTVRCEPEEACPCNHGGLQKFWFALRKALGLLSCYLVPHENYSSQYVTLGVLFEEGKIPDPLHPGGYLEGSSFSTPVVAGKLAAIFSDNRSYIENTLPADGLRNFYLSKLSVRHHHSLLAFVRNGRFIKP